MISGTGFKQEAENMEAGQDNPEIVREFNA